ncbi:hypothetical protein D3C72_2081680 [compost metagenome]
MVATAAARLPTVKTKTVISMVHLRVHPAVKAVRTGAAKVAPSAYVVTALPACSISTFRLCAMTSVRPMGTNSARPSANALSVKM